MTTGPSLQSAGQRWLLYWAFWTVLGLAFAAQLYLSRANVGNPVSWTFALSRNLADWYMFAVLAIPVLVLARRLPLAGRDWPGRAALHALGSVAFSVAWMAGRAGVETVQSGGTGRPTGFSDAFSYAFVTTFFVNVVVYWVIVAVRHAFDYSQKLHEREMRTAELERGLTEARLQALQMQLNPHFLFNTLNAISSLMHKDVEAADRMIARLSDLLRYALESTSAQEVPLEQELHFLRRYLEIQQQRFGDRLTVTMEVAPDTLAIPVPNLILQPLVENAIVHGIAPHARPGRIVLSARCDPECLRLEVRDNGKGLNGTAAPDEGVGLGNTRARLVQLYGPAHRFEFTRAPEGGLCVVISVPLLRPGGRRPYCTSSPSSTFQ